MFDYNIITHSDGSETYSLQGLPADSKCVIRQDHGYGGRIWFVRSTVWHGKVPGKRYSSYATLDEALASGIAWAKRRTREEEGR